MRAPSHCPSARALLSFPLSLSLSLSHSRHIFSALLPLSLSLSLSPAFVASSSSPPPLHPRTTLIQDHASTAHIHTVQPAWNREAYFLPPLSLTSPLSLHRRLAALMSAAQYSLFVPGCPSAPGSPCAPADVYLCVCVCVCVCVHTHTQARTQPHTSQTNPTHQKTIQKTSILNQHDPQGAPKPQKVHFLNGKKKTPPELPVTPRGPGAPGAPGPPLAPSNPIAPATPGAPGVPLTAVMPAVPILPITPNRPTLPWTPMGPVFFFYVKS